MAGVRSNASAGGSTVLATYQVTLAVPLVDQISGIPARLISEGIPFPVAFATHVLLHELLEVFDVDIVRCQSGAWTQGILQSDDELIESIVGDTGATAKAERLLGGQFADEVHHGQGSLVDCLGAVNWSLASRAEWTAAGLVGLTAANWMGGVPGLSKVTVTAIERDTRRAESIDELMDRRNHDRISLIDDG